jgi:hypothetical protein
LQADLFGAAAWPLTARRHRATVPVVGKNVPLHGSWIGSFQYAAVGVMFVLALAPPSPATEARGAHVVGGHADLAELLDHALILPPKVID